MALAENRRTVSTVPETNTGSEQGFLTEEMCPLVIGQGILA